MQRDIFRRGVRFIHKFGDLKDVADPLNSVGSFDPPWPKRIDDLSKMAAGKPLEVGADGQHMYREAPSPICKPAGGYASINGPMPDIAQEVGMPIPVGTKRRLGPLKTDK